jgi:NTP pyrophosphatase (non-canonical NTP hydrolase)
VNGARQFIGIAEVPLAVAAVEGHARATLQRRRDRGLPTCGDDVAELRKLSALMEEVGEVAGAIQDSTSRAHLRDELLDVATAASLWAWSIGSETDSALDDAQRPAEGGNHGPGGSDA